MQSKILLHTEMKQTIKHNTEDIIVNKEINKY